MSSNTDDQLLEAFELHSLEGLQALLDAGLDPRAPVRGKLPLQWLTEMYTRSDRFADLLRLLLEAGAELDDPAAAPVLLNDREALGAAISHDPSLLGHRTDMVSAFTPLEGATLLHVAAEYGHLEAARVLLDAGAEVDARAAVDEHGLGGHTPLFHTVNSHANRSQPLLRLLLGAGARADVRVDGLVWGRGFEWETVLLDLTPVSYAQLGLLPQFHRREADVYANLELLLKAANRPLPPFRNVPNRYLSRKTRG